jgi:hypothetical protein
MDRTTELLHIRHVRRQMSLRLAMWAGASMVVALMVFAAQPSIPTGVTRSFIQALAAQCLLWGLIDAGFALFGLRQAQAADRAGMAVQTIHRELADRDRLVRVLNFSGKLDVVWVGLGILLIAIGAGLRNAPLMGHGVGVLIQGGFLMWFDRSFLKSLTNPADASSIGSGR